MRFGLQIKTFKFIDKSCDEIDIEVNMFLQNIIKNDGSINDINSSINSTGNIIFITVKYVCSEFEKLS
ncbi:MAG: hypothetical protein ACLS2V_13125 [Clostridium paraputrificum]|uniref:hypothetical protein n=1 Tax=Clostridium sp. TaxID=1506 RepID=UPI0025B80E47|nr:hypothetical protein [Clostridium sp.]MBS5926170.1 hypothetical protein [Clostridium sp.]